MPLRSPPGLVGMLDRSLAILLDQLSGNLLEEFCQAMKNLHQAAGANLSLFTDPPHRDAVQVVHDRCRRDQLIAIKAFGKNLRGVSLKHLLAMRTVLLGKPKEYPLGLQRLTFDHQPLLHPFFFQRPPAIGAR